MEQRVAAFSGVPVVADDTAARRPTLRLLTCGSVDDGKSTLIGRLLYEQELIFDDQLAALERDSKKHRTVGDEIDFALLVDGLEAEREQGITIDVAYRYFATSKRSFIVADTPGHEQYTRNMATGASNAELAIILVDARKGLLTQTFRHSTIVSLLGIRHVVLAVNKIDLVSFDETIFRSIVAEFQRFAEPLGFHSITPIPISARYGDNISSRSANTLWYTGEDLVSHLEEIDVAGTPQAKPFRMPVQWVNRPHLDFRGFAGTITGGAVAVGDEVVVASSGRGTRVKRIVTADGDLARAEAGEAVTLTFADEVDVARGDVLADPRNRPLVSDQFAAHLVWMNEEKLLPGRVYLIKIATRTLPVTVTAINHRIDVNTLATVEAEALVLNEVGFCTLTTAAPIVFDAYAESREMGGFILIDRFSNATVAAGMISHSLWRATNVHRQDLAVAKQDRARLKHQKPAILWFTGLSGAGKSTIANLVESRLHARGFHSMLLDGDNIRHGLNKDLGFTDIDRVENIRRVGEVAKLMTEAGLIVLCAFISPFRAERQMVRELVAEGEFIEIFVDTPLDECIARDPKGLYKRALAGEIRDFTGVGQPYEAPQAPDLVLGAAGVDAETLADQVIHDLVRRGLIWSDDLLASPGEGL
jgi:bifunctional enzyme CysN/CysC